MKKILVAALLLLTNFAIAQNPADTAKSPGAAQRYALPQMPPLKKGVFVTDLTGTLSSSELADLNKRATTIKQKSGYELIIVVLDALPKGIDVNDATSSIDETWNPGDNPNVDRLIYIAGLKQHGHRITAARGAKAGVVFDKARCTSILTAMKPDYDKHEYNKGLQLMVDSVSTILNIDTGQSSSNSTNVYIGAVVLAFLLLLYIYFKNRQKTPQQA